TYPPSLPVVAQPVRRVNPHVSPHRLFISPYSRPRIAIPAVSGSSSGALRGSRRKHARTRGQSAPRDGAHRATGFTARRGSPRDGGASGPVQRPLSDETPVAHLSLPCRSPDEAFRSNQVLGSAAESGARRERGDGLGRRSREGDRRGNVARRTRGRPRVGLPGGVSGGGGVVASPES